MLKMASIAVGGVIGPQDVRRKQNLTKRAPLAQ